MSTNIRVYSNRKPDFVLNAFLLHSSSPKRLMLASPFFSNAPLIENMVSRGCSVQLIVRLGEATSPDHLRRLIDNPRIQVRFFTARTFHSKLYIFGSDAALVGSANLTDSGINSNQEICIEIPGGTDGFDRLLSIFQSYWNEAHVLTAEGLEKYRAAYSQKSARADKEFDDALIKAFGEIAPSGIQVTSGTKAKDKLFIHEYAKTYQEFLLVFETLKSIYVDDGRRKISEEAVPLRIEIDQFLSFIREKHASGDSYLEQPILVGDELRSSIRKYLDLWHKSDWPYLMERIPESLERIRSVLGSTQKIQDSSIEEIFDALTVCHSVRDRLRFFKGGLPQFKKTFVKENDPSRVKALLTHSLFGSENFVERMADCIFDPAFEIRQFGKSNVQELFGWLNSEDVPICNSRTVRMMRFLGLDVKVFE